MALIFNPLPNTDYLLAVDAAVINATNVIQRKIDPFKHYVIYMNENGFLKYQLLSFEQTPTGSWVFYCKFTELAFIIGFFYEGSQTKIPAHSMNNLSIKEIAIMQQPYFKETWIEKEDFRKVDTYFAFCNTDFMPE